MRIVFLDAATVDLGDVDMSALRRVGAYHAFRDTRPSQIVSRARNADVIVTNKCVLGETELSRLPRLRLICVAATGVNNVDLISARRRGVAVANVAGYSTATVAEHALMFLLALSHRLPTHHEAAVSGAWSRSPHFAWLGRPFCDLEGKTLGIVGFGSIGRRVARLAASFGMKIALARIPGRSYRKGDARRLSLRSVMKRSDFLSLHCPLTKTTRHLINRRSLAWMKPTAFLLNLARGPVVEETAVARALEKGRLAGYAADVLSEEPPPRAHPLLARRLTGKVLLTPHIAWASRESRQRLVREMAQNIRAFKNGRRRNRVV
ncbi:MAG TPA: D-2-hydroxyacid dehydrogenase [bacterium]|nr:D-2-hydroxyacid dehydrogenase [bacterium]